MKRQQVPPTDDWQQLQLLAKTPEQRTYELIRPVVLFGQPARPASSIATKTGVCFCVSTPMYILPLPCAARTGARRGDTSPWGMTHAPV